MLQSAVQRLLALKTRYFKVSRDGKITEDTGYPVRDRLIILSGSFNPLHLGHVELLKVASTSHPSAEPVFELSCSNADKGFLKQADIMRRLQQFRGSEWGDWSVIATVQMPAFVNKSAVFQNAVFVVGMDTAERVLMPKYYDNSEEKMIRELKSVASRGGKFLVAGRYNASSKQFVSELKVPDQISDLFEFLPSFRVDVSSTELRAKVEAQTKASL